MATLTPVATLNDNGLGVADIGALAVAAADASNDFANDGDTFLIVVNDSAGTVTATAKSQPDPFGRGGAADTQCDEAIAVPTLKMGMLPFLTPAAWNAGGKVTFTLSATADVRLALVRMKKLR